MWYLQNLQITSMIYVTQINVTQFSLALIFPIGYDARFTEYRKENKK